MQSIQAGVQQGATWVVGDVMLSVFIIALVIAAVGGWFTRSGIMPFLTVMAIGGAVFASPQIATTIKSWFS